MLKDAGGIPDHGDQRSEWDAGRRFGFENPRIPLTGHSFTQSRTN